MIIRGPCRYWLLAVYVLTIIVVTLTMPYIMSEKYYPLLNYCSIPNNTLIRALKSIAVCRKKSLKRHQTYYKHLYNLMLDREWWKRLIKTDIIDRKIDYQVLIISSVKTLNQILYQFSDKAKSFSFPLRISAVPT